MTEPRLSDDVLELCRSANLEPSRYVRFPFPEGFAAKTAPAVPMATDSTALDLVALASPHVAASQPLVVTLMPLSEAPRQPSFVFAGFDDSDLRHVAMRRRIEELLNADSLEESDLVFTR